MTERDDERRLRDAFARLREDEAQRAPSLAQLRARAEASRGARVSRFAWLRLAVPLAGAVAAGFVWWISARAPGIPEPQLAARNPDRRVIAVGSLRSPTDALLASPVAALPSGFSRSLIPAPRIAPAPAPEQQSYAGPPRRMFV